MIVIELGATTVMRRRFDAMILYSQVSISVTQYSYIDTHVFLMKVVQSFLRHFDISDREDRRPRLVRFRRDIELLCYIGDVCSSAKGYPNRLDSHG